MCIYLQRLQLHEDFTIEFEGEILTETHLKDQLTHLASSWLGDFSFSNLPRSFLSQEEEEQSIFHPIIDDLILDDAGGISVSKVGGVSGLIFFVIFFSCALCLWKIPSYRNYIYKILTRIVQQCYNSCTSKSYREKKENLALRKDVADKKQMLLKNIEDLNLIKKFKEGMTRGCGIQ